MATWHEITRDPEYQSLSAEAKAVVKRGFFDRQIVADPEFQGFPKATQDAISNEFWNTPDDTGQGYITSMMGAAGRGFGEILPGAIQGAGALTGISPLESAGKSIREGIEYISPVNPLYAESVPVKGAGVVGQIGSVLATAGVGGAVGKGLAAERIAAAAEPAIAASQAVGRGANAALYGSAALQGGASGAQTADQYGLTGANRYGNILAGAAGEVLSERLPFGLAAETAAAKRILGGAPQAGRFLGAVGTEGAEESINQLAQNAALKALAPVGTETPDLTEGVLEAGAYGAFGGSLLGGVNLATGAYKSPATIAAQALTTAAENTSPDVGLSVAAAKNTADLSDKADQAQTAADFAENLRKTQEEGAAADIQAAQMRAQEEYAAAQEAAARQTQYESLTPNEPLATAPVGSPVLPVGEAEVADLEAGAGIEGDLGAGVLPAEQLAAIEPPSPEGLAGDAEVVETPAIEAPRITELARQAAAIASGAEKGADLGFVKAPSGEQRYQEAIDAGLDKKTASGLGAAAELSELVKEMQNRTPEQVRSDRISSHREGLDKNPSGYRLHGSLIDKFIPSGGQDAVLKRTKTGVEVVAGEPAWTPKGEKPSKQIKKGKVLATYPSLEDFIDAAYGITYKPGASGKPDQAAPSVAQAAKATAPGPITPTTETPTNATEGQPMSGDSGVVEEMTPLPGVLPGGEREIPMAPTVPYKKALSILQRRAQKPVSLVDMQNVHALVTAGNSPEESAAFAIAESMAHEKAREAVTSAIDSGAIESGKPAQDLYDKVYQQNAPSPISPASQKETPSSPAAKLEKEEVVPGTSAKMEDGGRSISPVATKETSQAETSSGKVEGEDQVYDRLFKSAQSLATKNPVQAQSAMEKDVANLTGGKKEELQRLADMLGEKVKPTVRGVATEMLAAAQETRQPDSRARQFYQETVNGRELRSGDVVSWTGEDGKPLFGKIRKLDEDKGLAVIAGSEDNQGVSYTVPMEELALDNSVSRESRRKAYDSIIGEPKGVEMNSVSPADGQEALAKLHNTGDVPGVLNAFVGTSQEFLANKENEQNYPELWKIIKGGRVDEGNFAYGRAFVFTDGIGINDSDRRNALKLGVTPSVAAVRRVLLHESLVHRGIYGLPQHLKSQVLQWMRQNASPEQLDNLAKDYPQYENWRNNEAQMLGLTEEFLAKTVEKLTKMPTNGPLARLMDILRDIWRWMTGNTGEPTVQNLRDVVKLLKAGVEAADAKLVNGGGIKMSQVGNDTKTLLPSSDEYLKTNDIGGVGEAELLGQYRRYANDYLNWRAKGTGLFNLVSSIYVGDTGGRVASAGYPLQTRIGEDDRITIDIGNPIPSGFKGDEATAKKRIADAVDEEIIHAADLLALKAKWENNGSKGKLSEFILSETQKATDDTLKSYSGMLAADKSAMDSAIEASFSMYFGKSMGVKLPDFIAALRNNGRSDIEITMLAELTRQVIQLRQTGGITETGWRSISKPLIEWMRKMVNALRIGAQKITDGQFGKILQARVNNAEEQLRQLISVPEIKASRISYANPLDAQLANAAERMRGMREKQVPQEVDEPSPGGLSEAEDIEDEYPGVFRLFNAIMSSSDPGAVFSDKVSIQRPGSRIAGYFLGASADAVRGYGDRIKELAVTIKKPLILHRENYTPIAFFEEMSKAANVTLDAEDLDTDTKEPVSTFFSPGMAANPFHSRNLAEQLVANGYDAVVMWDDSAYEGTRKRPTVWIPYQKASNIRVSQVNPSFDSPRAGSERQQIRNEIRAAYNRAIEGEGSVQASLQKVFDEVKKQIPTLTEKQFGEQVQALYEDGSAFLVPTDRSSDMLAAGEKWGVYDVAGLPASYLGVMPSLDQPIKAYATGSIFQGGRGRVYSSMGKAAHGAGVASIPAGDNSERAQTLRRVVDEGVWANSTPMQRKEALDAFGEELYRRNSAALSSDALESVSTRRTIRPEENPSATINGESNREVLLVDFNTTIHPKHDILNQSALEAFAFMYDAMNEEMIHLAQHIATWREWIASGSKQWIDVFQHNKYVSMLNDVVNQRFDPVAKSKIDWALMTSWNMYHPNNPKSSIEEVFAELQGHRLEIPAYMMELGRQLVQIGRQDFTTETGWARFKETLIKWANEIRNALRSVLADVKGGTFGKLLKNEIDAIEGVISHLESGGGVMPQEVKASRVAGGRKKADISPEIREQVKLIGSNEELALNRHRALKALREAQPKFHIKQDDEPIVAVAINIVDALKASGAKPQELNNYLTDPEFLDDLGIPIDSSLYQALAMEIYNQQQEEVTRLEKAGNMGAANKLRRYVSAMQKHWYESGTRGGQRLNIRKQLINNPRYQGLFLATHLNEAMRENAQEKAEAQTNIRAEDIEGADKKAQDAASENVADEFADLEMEELDRLGEEQLDAEEKSLWRQIKDYIADLGAIALANIQAAASNIMASNAAMSAGDRVKKFLAMTQNERNSKEAEIHTKLKAAMKKFMGRGTEAQKRVKKDLVDGAEENAKKDRTKKTLKDKILNQDQEKAFAAMMRKLSSVRRANKTPFKASIPWKKLFSLSKATQAERRADMEAAIREDESLRDLSDEDQAKLADLIEAAWEAQRKNVFDREIDRLTRLKKTSAKAKAALIEGTPKLLEMINQGALDNDELYALIAEKFGFKPLSPEQKSEIEKIAQQLQDDLPPYKRSQLVSKFKDIITDVADVPFAQKAADWWVTAVLSSPRTAFTIGLGFLSGGYQVLSTAFSTVVRHSGDINAWKAAGAAINDWVSSMPRHAGNALGFLWDGREDRLDPTMSNISAWLNLDKKSLTQTSTAAALLKSKNPISRLAGGFMTFFQRLLTALDLFNAMATKDGSLALAYYQTRQSQNAPFSIQELSNLRNFKAARNQVLATEFNNVEPSSPAQKTLLNSWANQLMWQQIAKFEGVVENATFNAQQGAMSLDPSGVGGILYHAILGTQAKLKEGSTKFMQGAKKDWLDADSNTDKAIAFNKMALAYFYQFAAHNLMSAVGLRFIRYAGNRLNQTISFVPGLGLFRLHEKEGAPQEMLRSQILANQTFGTILGIWAVILLKEMADEPDEEKRGWGWEGGWDALTPERKSQRMSAGKQPYTLTLGGKTFKYQNWPGGGIMAAVGSLMDMAQYAPDKWNERTIPGKIGSALLASALSVTDSASLSQFSQMFGRSVQTRDPLDAATNTLSKFGAGYVGGFIPRIAKDVDAMFSPEIYRAKAPFEFMAREVPVYRRGQGSAILDIFAKPVAPSRSPSSREFIEQPTEPEYRQIGRLNEHGIWLTPASPDNRLVGKGARKRHMTDEEGLRYIKATGNAYREFVLRNTDRILSMPPERARQFVLDKADDIRDRAAKQAVRIQ